MPVKVKAKDQDSQAWQRKRPMRQLSVMSYKFRLLPLLPPERRNVFLIRYSHLFGDLCMTALLHRCKFNNSHIMKGVTRLCPRFY